MDWRESTEIRHLPCIRLNLAQIPALHLGLLNIMASTPIPQSKKKIARLLQIISVLTLFFPLIGYGLHLTILRVILILPGNHF